MVTGISYVGGAAAESSQAGPLPVSPARGLGTTIPGLLAPTSITQGTPSAPSPSQEGLICRDMKTSGRSSRAAHATEGCFPEEENQRGDRGLGVRRQVSTIYNRAQGLGRSWKRQKFPGSQHMHPKERRPAAGPGSPHRAETTLS